MRRIVLTAVLFFLPLKAQAENNCTFSVRSIKASDYSREFENKELEVGSGLSDVQEQLEPLPYKKFQIINSTTGAAELNENLKLKIVAADGQAHSIALKPENPDSIGIALNIVWTDERDDQVLSTKVQLKNDRPVVIGTDHEGKVSTVLCISAVCR